MLVLALDSSADACGVCIWRDGRVVDHHEEQMERGQDRRLIPLLQSTLQKSGLVFADFDRLAVIKGPGSFTGLRIGLATARGISLAANKPLVGIDRFSIYRRLHPSADGGLLVVLNSKREEFYCRAYFSVHSEVAPWLMTADAIRLFLETHPSMVPVGDIKSAPGINVRQASTPEVVVCAALSADADLSLSSSAPKPLYVRAPDVTTSAPRTEVITSAHAVELSSIHQDAFPSNGWDVAQLASSLSLSSTAGIINYVNNEPVGFVLTQQTEDEIEILTFCVREAFQRRSFGKDLLNVLCAKADAERKLIRLEVAADNLRAQKLYEKSGFQASGRRAGYYKRPSGPVDTVLYTRPFAIV